jgi:hypothetical protein
MPTKNLSQDIDKSKGSDELMSLMLHGDVKDIANAFDIPYPKAYNWISGKNYGNKLVVDCAKDLANFYKESNLSKNRIDIINSYTKKSKK